VTNNPYESYLQNPRGKQANGNWIKCAALSIAARCVTLIGIQQESLSHLPVPLKLTVCGLPGSLSLMTRVADRAPAAVGLNARLIVHLPSPATLLPTAQGELD
jgi:NAD-dependent oxidoreductase involved in siderophore biosynthesis